MVASFAITSTMSASLFAADIRCGEAFVTTFQVQGRGDASPLAETTVAIEAVVTAEFTGSSSAGAQRLVFVQDPEGDGDDASSDGLAVYVDATTVIGDDVTLAVGELLRVWGSVLEYDGETQLVAFELVRCGEGEPPLPVDLTFPLAATRRWSETAWVADFEPREGMLARLPGGLRVNDVSATARHGELSLVQGELPWVFTHMQVPNTTEYQAYERGIARRSIALDDGSDALYADYPWPTVALGSELGAPLIGIVREPRADAPPGQAAYRLVPTEAPSFQTWRPPTPTSNENSKASRILRVVSANLHNLFSDGGDSGTCYPSNDASDCRGEASADARAAHLVSSARHIASLEPDVIAASEVQNDFGEGGETWKSWVRQLGAAVAERSDAEVGAGHCSDYRPVLPDVYLGGDAIAVAVAYCADQLELTDVSWPSDEDRAGWGPGTFGEPNTSRVPLLAEFRVRSNGRRWALVANHFKSRAPGVLAEKCPTEGGRDCDVGDGQGFWNATRLAAASAIATWLERWDVPVLLVGDLNAYAHEDPMNRLTESGFALLTAAQTTVPSYVYAGRLGVLDHAFVSERDLEIIQRARVVAHNVGQGLDKLVYSDHNPVFVDLDFEAPTTCDCQAVGAVTGTVNDDVLLGTPQSDVICGYGGDDVLVGLGGDDCVSGGLGEDWLVVDPSTSVYDGEHVVAPNTSAATCDR